MTETRRGPLSREEAMRWQLQSFANRNPTEKERIIRQALAAMPLPEPPDFPPSEA